MADSRRQPPPSASSTHSSNGSAVSGFSQRLTSSIIEARTFPQSKATTSPVRSSTDPPTPSEPPRKPSSTMKQWKNIPLARRVLVLERVNKLRAWLGLPEKNLDNTLRPRKSRPVAELSDVTTCERDSASSVYSQESAAEQAHSHSSDIASTDLQMTSIGYQAADKLVWENPYACLDEPPQFYRHEQCP